MKNWRTYAALLGNIALALLAVGACLALYRFTVLALLQQILKVDDSVIAVLRPLGQFSAAMIGYALFVHFYERRPVTEFAIKPASMALGGLSGSILIAVTILPLFALGYYSVQSVRGFGAVPEVVARIFLVASLEELVFRAIVFRLLEQRVGTLRALLIQSALFAALHMFNAGAAVMTLLSMTVVGALWTMVYVFSRNIWVAGCNHAAWNATIFMYLNLQLAVGQRPGPRARMFSRRRF
jgi:membrane protease YdiL (CAAX protease family)